MAIENIPIRATISFESGLSVSTPYILSFNVNKNRGQPGTFSASIKVSVSDIENMHGKIAITAGQKDNQIRIFTGYVKNVVPSPCWDDPAFFVVNLSGVDELFKLENRKITRRQIITDKSWAVIDGVVSQGSQVGKLKYTSNAPLVLMSDAQTLKKLEVYTPDQDKNSHEPKYDTNSPKEKDAIVQNIEGTIGFIDTTIDDRVAP